MRLRFLIPLFLVVAGNVQASEPLASASLKTNHFSYEGELAWTGNTKPYTQGKVKFRQIHAPGARSALIWTEANTTADWAVSQQPGPDVLWELKKDRTQSPQDFDTDAFLKSFLGPRKAVDAETLSYWWKGQADPRHPATQMKADDEGRPQSFKQQGWKIKYESWAPTQNGMMPDRFQLKRGRLKINIVQVKVDSSQGPFPPSLSCPVPAQAP